MVQGIPSGCAGWSVFGPRRPCSSHASNLRNLEPTRFCSFQLIIGIERGWGSLSLIHFYNFCMMQKLQQFPWTPICRIIQKWFTKWLPALVSKQWTITNNVPRGFFFLSAESWINDGLMSIESIVPSDHLATYSQIISGEFQKFLWCFFVDIRLETKFLIAFGLQDTTIFGAILCLFPDLSVILPSLLGVEYQFYFEYFLCQVLLEHQHIHCH